MYQMIMSCGIYLKKIIVNPGELVYNALCMNMSLVGGLSMYTEKFIAYLKNEKKMSPNTLEAYFRDVREFIAFEGERGNAKPEEVTSTDIIAFLNSRKNMGKSSATVNRKLASGKGVFQFPYGGRSAHVEPYDGDTFAEDREKGDRVSFS